MTAGRATLLLAGALLAAPAALAADSFRCQGTIIERGMAAAEVHRLCGEPGYEQRSNARRVVKEDNGAVKIRYQDIRALLYDPEAGAFVRIVYLVGGKVHHVEALPRRGRLARRGAPACLQPPGAVGAGDPAALIGYVCGEPDERQPLAEEIPRQGVSLLAEWWTYRLKDGKTQRLLVVGDRVAQVPN